MFPFDEKNKIKQEWHFLDGGEVWKHAKFINLLQNVFYIKCNRHNSTVEQFEDHKYVMLL